MDNICVLCPFALEEDNIMLDAPTLLDHEFWALIVHAIFLISQLLQGVAMQMCVALLAQSHR